MRLVLCVITAACALLFCYNNETIHDKPFSVASEESLTDSEPPDFLTGPIKGNGRLHEI